MSNPENLIRPPVLNIPIQEPVNPNRNQVIMEETIARICAQQCQMAIRQYLNPSADIAGVDQFIDERYRNDLADLDKVPDVVRSLREFNGNAAEFSSWKKSVDRILRLYESKIGTPKYFAILNTIRNKITGNADAALESYNTPLNWESISKCLTLHYADKRDLTTLEYQMTTLVQGNKRIQDYYQEVYSHLSLIMNKLSCMDISRESLDLLAQTYRDKALDTFIRGLKGHLPIHLGMKEPRDLPQALQLCLKMENQIARAHFANSHGQTNRTNMQSAPQYPPRHPQVATQLHPRGQYHTNSSFYPQLAHMPQPYSNGQHFKPAPFTRPQHYYNQLPQGQFHPNNYAQPPRPLAPKPQPRPEPMDIDPSTRSRAVNYMNRPAQNQFFGKRPNDQPDQIRDPRKIQRNFHLDTEESGDSNPQTYESQLENYESEEKFLPLNDYIENEYDVLDDKDQLDTQEFADIHFLD